MPRLRAGRRAYRGTGAGGRRRRGGGRGRAGAPAWLAAELATGVAGYGDGLAPALEVAAAEPGPTEAELAALDVPVGVAALMDDPCIPWRSPGGGRGAAAVGARHGPDGRVRRGSGGGRARGGARVAARGHRAPPSRAVVSPGVLVVRIGGSVVECGLASPPPAACVPALVEQVGRRPRVVARAAGPRGLGRRRFRLLRPRPLGRWHARRRGVLPAPASVTRWLVADARGSRRSVSAWLRCGGLPLARGLAASAPLGAADGLRLFAHGPAVSWRLGLLTSRSRLRSSAARHVRGDESS